MLLRLFSFLLQLLLLFLLVLFFGDVFFVASDTLGVDIDAIVRDALLIVVGIELLSLFLFLLLLLGLLS